LHSFHIKMSIIALCFAKLHAIGHLSGSFFFGSRPKARKTQLRSLLGTKQYRVPTQTILVPYLEGRASIS
jgi:hypothetical protein